VSHTRDPQKKDELLKVETFDFFTLSLSLPRFFDGASNIIIFYVFVYAHSIKICDFAIFFFCFFSLLQQLTVYRMTILSRTFALVDDKILF
jgi:hypothetical protein